MDARKSYIALNMIEGIGPVTVASLVSELGTAEAVLSAQVSDLSRAKGVGPKIAARIAGAGSEIDVDAEIRKADALGARIITRLDDEYPESLKSLRDAPLVLYVIGSLEPADRNAIAVVGTRRASMYGRETAERLSYQLSRAGYVIISGLALGIDTAAHQGALKGHGRTIAVIGCGLGSLYPPENKKLAESISGSGAVISEYPIDRKPDKSTFPARNRIVSGMSKGVLVVEADRRSGAMITADLALGQGRDVYAVPGRIDASGSRGPHRLIRDGALLVETAEDIIEDIESLLSSSAMKGMPDAPAERAARPAMNADEQLIYEALEDGSMDVDTLARTTGLAARKTSSLMISLEMKRVLRMLPGGIVELRRQV